MLDKELEPNDEQPVTVPDAEQPLAGEAVSAHVEGSMTAKQPIQESEVGNDHIIQETIDNVCTSQGIHPREINQFLGYSWDVESNLKCSRKAAEAMAGELLKRDSPPLTSENLQMLILWKFKSNPYRKNAMPYGREFVYSGSFGMSVARNQ